MRKSELTARCKALENEVTDLENQMAILGASLENEMTNLRERMTRLEVLLRSCRPKVRCSADESGP